VVNYRHLPEAIPSSKALEEVILAVPGFQHGGFACLKDEERVTLVVFAEKELISRN
jgi:hypothetical protein